MEVCNEVNNDKQEIEWIIYMTFVHQNLASCLDVQDVHGIHKFAARRVHLHGLGASKDNSDRRRLSIHIVVVLLH